MITIIITTIIIITKIEGRGRRGPPQDHPPPGPSATGPPKISLFFVSRLHFHYFFPLLGLSWNCERGSRPNSTQKTRLGFFGVILCERRRHSLPSDSGHVWEVLMWHRRSMAQKTKHEQQIVPKSSPIGQRFLGPRMVCKGFGPKTV